MKNIFEWNRFVKVLRKDAIDLRRPLQTFILGALGLGLIAFALSLFLIPEASFSRYELGRLILFILLGLAALAFGSFLLYKQHNHRIKGVGYFMLPASAPEKFLSMFIYSAVLLPLGVLCSIMLLDVCLSPFYPWEGAFCLLEMPPVRFRAVLEMVTFAYAGQSLFFLCNIWFSTAKMQKTFGLIIVFVVLVLLTDKWMGMLFPDTIPDVPRENQRAWSMAFFEYSTWWIRLKSLLIWIGTLGLWAAAFLKLKEQEL